MNANHKYMISAVICTYNNLPLLKQSVKALVNQTLDKTNYEVLIVDNNSDDGTAEYIKTILSEHHYLRYIRESNQGLSYARNRGIDESKGKIITFIDDDAIAEKDLLKVIVEKFTTYPSLVCLGGRILPKIEFEVKEWFLKWYRNYIVLSYDAGDKDIYLDNNHGPVGAKISFLKDIFQYTGKFDTALGRTKDKYIANEEELIINKIKQTKNSCLYTPDAVVYHIAKPNRVGRKFLLHRAFYKGVSDARSGYDKEEIIHKLGKPVMPAIIVELKAICKRIIRLPSTLIKKLRRKNITSETYHGCDSTTATLKVKSQTKNHNISLFNKLKHEIFDYREKLFSIVFMSGFYNVGFYFERFKIFYKRDKRIS